MKSENLRKTPPISMGGPDITEREIQEVVEVLKGPSLSRGERLKLFEKEFAAYTGSDHAIGVSSGTAGLHLSVIAAGIQENDLVLTTPFTFIASSNSILFERAVPIFVDVDPETGNLDARQAVSAVEDLAHGADSPEGRRHLPRKLRNKLAHSSMKAILPVHVFGQPAEMEELLKVTDVHSLAVIEDACEAVGSEYQGRAAGTMGDFGVFGFYPNKQMTTAEGGMVVTNSEDAANLIRSLRNQGREPNCDWLAHSRLGYNYRLNEMSAALGLVQLRRLDEMLEKRARVASWYSKRLPGVPGIQQLTVSASTTRMSWFVYVIRLLEPNSRDRLIGKLRKQGIPCRPYFPPVHLSSFYIDRFGYRVGDFPVAEKLGRNCLALPFSGVMTEDQVDFVCTQLRKATDQ